MRPALLLLIPLFAIISIARPESGTTDQDLRQEVLDDIVEHVLLPAHADFAREAKKLRNHALEMSNSPTPEIVPQLQNSFLRTRLAWKHCELFNLGRIRQSFVHEYIDHWPTNAFLVDQLLKTAELKPENIANLNPEACGLPALEHLLFPDLDADPDSLAFLFTDAPTAEKRRSVFLGLADNIHSRAKIVHRFWSPQGNDYGSQWAASRGSGDMDALKELVNSMIKLLHDCEHEKLGEAMGRYDREGPDPQKFEAWRSGQSHALLKANLQTMQDVFTGKGGGKGLRHLLDDVATQHSGKPLSEVISDQFEAAHTALLALKSPMREHLEQQMDEYQAAYQKLSTLLRLFRTDVISSLGLSILNLEADSD
jgi:predicted lipoprotein